MTRTTALLFILGTGLIYIGFGAFPPRIYTERNVQAKLKLLAEQPRLWRVAQSFVILGGIVAAVASIFLPSVFSGTQAARPATIGAAVFAVGHIPWIWAVGLRAVHPELFAKGELPGWLFRTYSILVLLGLASFGVAFWLQGIYLVLGAGLFLGALLVLALYFKFNDMPPFIYYAITLALGLTLLLG
ncbi:MAG: hypothetical protein WA996_10310 [Candidatus Promineifilaceae bacterium]